MGNTVTTITRAGRAHARRLARAFGENHARLGRALAAVGAVVGMAQALLGGPAFAQTQANVGAGQTPVPPRDLVGVRERPRPEFEPPNVRLGAFMLEPAARTEVSYTDNLFYAERGARSDAAATFGLGLNARSLWSRHALQLSARAERNVQRDFPKEDATIGGVTAEVRIDVRRDWTVTLGATYDHFVERRNDPDSPVSALKPVEVDSNRFYISAQQVLDRLRLTARAEQASFRYDNGLLRTGGAFETSDRDRVETTADLRAEIALRPGFAVLGQVSLNDRKYDNVFDTLAKLDSNGQNLLVGLSFEASRLVQGDVAIGYLRQNYDAARFGTIEGVAATARLTWYPRELTTVTLNGRRSAEDSVGGAVPAPYVATTVGLAVDHELRRNLVVGARLDVGGRAYERIRRDDEVFTVGADATLYLNRRVRVVAGYAFERQESSGVDRDRDYEANRVFTAVHVRL